MFNYLIGFQRDFRVADSLQPDLAEKIGQWGTGWLSLGFGKTVKVVSIDSKNGSRIIFKEATFPAWQRICALVLAIIFFPVSLLAAGIGCIGFACSESRAKLEIDYRSFQLKVKDEPKVSEEKTPEIPKFSEPFAPKKEEIILPSTPKIIPPKCDIRGTKWLTNTKVYRYAVDCLKRVNPNVCFFLTSTMNQGLSQIKSHIMNLKQLKFPLPEAFAFTPTVEPYCNHWSLVYVCRKTRTIEYYDSKVAYGDPAKMIGFLEAFAKQMDFHDPGETSYNVVSKIKICLQPDGYQCGPWVLFFLEQRVQNPDFDFNALDIDQAQKMIADYRLKIMDKLIELYEKKPW